MEWRKKQNDREGIVESCELFIRRFPRSDLTPKYLLELAEFYRDEWNSLSKAAETYSQMIREFPESPQAETGAIRLAHCHFQNEDYERAKKAFQEFLRRYPVTTHQATAEFYVALCESGAGNREQAKALMLRILESHPDNPIAPRALFWLGLDRIVDGDFEDARNRFSQLVKSYPNSNLEVHARVYVERFSSLDE